MDKFWLKSYPAGVPAEIDYTQYRSLVHLMEEAFRKYADRDAYACMGKHITFAEVDEISHKLGACRRGARGSGKPARALSLVVPFNPRDIQRPPRGGRLMSHLLDLAQFRLGIAINSPAVR